MNFQYITNPQTNRKCLVKSPMGKRVLQNYLNGSQYGGVKAERAPIWVSATPPQSPKRSPRKSPKKSPKRKLLTKSKWGPQGLCTGLTATECSKKLLKDICSWSHANKECRRKKILSDKQKAALAAGRERARAARASRAASPTVLRNQAEKGAKAALGSTLRGVLAGLKAQGAFAKTASPKAKSPKQRKPTAKQLEKSRAADKRYYDRTVKEMGGLVGYDKSLTPKRSGVSKLSKGLQSVSADELDCIHYPLNATAHKKSCASQSPRCEWAKGTGCVPAGWQKGEPIPRVKQKTAKGGRRNYW